MKRPALWTASIALAFTLVIASASWFGASSQSNADQRIDLLEARVTVLEATVAAISANQAPTVATPVAESHTISGTFELGGTDGDEYSVLDEDCYGLGGYDDIYPGAEVRVKNESGQTIAVSRLEAASRTTRECRFTFELEVPRASFYEVSAGSQRRGGIIYSFDEMVENNWRVELYLG